MRLVLGAAGCVGLALLMLGACNAGGSNADGETCEPGTEDCDCYPNGTCNDGLSCIAKTICVSDEAAATSQSGGNAAGNTSAGNTSNESTSGGESTSAGDTTTSGGSGDTTSSSGTTSSTNAGVSTSDSTSGGGSGGASGGVVTTSSNTTSTSGDATTSGGGSGSTTTSVASTGGVADPALIDDFADCDGNIPEIDGRNGVWYMLGSTLSQEFTVGSPPDLLWSDQSCGVFATGTCAACSAAGLAVILDDGAHDLSGWTGIRVTYESEATVYVTLKTTDGSSYGYAQSAGLTPTGTSSGTREVSFASLTPDLNYHGLEWAQEIHFTLDDFSKSSGFGIGIHHVELY